MKRALALACTLCLCMALIGCGGKDKAAAPSISPALTPGESTPDALPSADAAPAAKVGQVVAYYFPSIGGVSSIYGAAEIINTGRAPFSVSSATFDFSIGGKSVSKTTQPIFSDLDVIEPGQTAHICIWSSYDPKDAAVDSVTATATVEIAAAQAGYAGLSLRNLRVIQNYPGFATLSGLIVNDSPELTFGYTVNYAAFYDQQDTLLGVWYYTKDASIGAHSQRDFVAQMKSLPLPGLAEKCARITGRSIGVG